jgi:hypothetical protein
MDGEAEFTIRRHNESADGNCWTTKPSVARHEHRRRTGIKIRREDFAVRKFLTLSQGTRFQGKQREHRGGADQ